MHMHTQLDAKGGLRISGTLQAPSVYIDGVYLNDLIKNELAKQVKELKADNLCTKMGVTQGISHQ